MGRVMHGRPAGVAFPVVATAPLHHVVKAMIPVVVVLGFPVDDMAEVALTKTVTTIDHAGIVGARLSNHVDATGLLDRLHKRRDFLVRDTCWHGGVDVFSGLQSSDRLRRVHPVLCDNRDRIHICGAEFLE